MGPEALKACCSEDETRHNIQTPFRTNWRGRRWASATDGHQMAAVAFDGDLRADGPDLTAVLKMAKAPTHAIDVAALRAWTGEVQPRRLQCSKCHGIPAATCDRCKGEGVREVDCDCPNCDGEHECTACDGNGAEVDCKDCAGDGWIKTPPRYALLLAGIVDLNVLARALSPAPATGRVLLSQAGEQEPYFLEMQDWLAAVMPIRGDASYRKQCVPSPALSLASEQPPAGPRPLPPKV